MSKKSIRVGLFLCAVLGLSVVSSAFVATGYADPVLNPANPATSASSSANTQELTITLRRLTAPHDYENLSLVLKPGQKLGDIIPRNPYRPTKNPFGYRWKYEMLERSYKITVDDPAANGIDPNKEYSWDELKELQPTENMTITGYRYWRHGVFTYQFYDARPQSMWTDWKPILPTITAAGIPEYGEVTVPWKEVRNEVWDHPEGKIKYREFKAELLLPNETPDMRTEARWSSIGAPIVPFTNGNNSDMQFDNNYFNSSPFEFGDEAYAPKLNGYRPMCGITTTSTVYYAFAPGATKDNPYLFTIKERYRGVRRTQPGDQNPDRTIKEETVVNKISEWDATKPLGTGMGIDIDTNDFPYIVNGGNIYTVTFKHALDLTDEHPKWPTSPDGVEGVNFMDFLPQNVEGFSWAYYNPIRNNGSGHMNRQTALAYFKNVPVTFDAGEGGTLELPALPHYVVPKDDPSTRPVGSVVDYDVVPHDEGLPSEPVQKLTLTGLRSLTLGELTDLQEGKKEPANWKNFKNPVIRFRGLVNPARVPIVHAPEHMTFKGWKLGDRLVDDPMSIKVEDDTPLTFVATYERSADNNYYQPKAQDLTFKQGDPAPEAKDFIANADELPAETQYSFKDQQAPSTADLVDHASTIVVISYPDGTSTELEVSYSVLSRDQSTDANKPQDDEKPGQQNSDHKQKQTHKAKLPKTGDPSSLRMVATIAVPAVTCLMAGALHFAQRKQN